MSTLLAYANHLGDLCESDEIHARTLDLDWCKGTCIPVHHSRSGPGGARRTPGPGQHPDGGTDVTNLPLGNKAPDRMTPVRRKPVGASGPAPSAMTGCSASSSAVWRAW